MPTSRVAGALVPISLLAGFAVVFFLRPDHRSPGVHEPIPAWAIVLLVAFVVFVLGAPAWWALRSTVDLSTGE
jgi:hypothetical protein